MKRVLIDKDRNHMVEIDPAGMTFEEARDKYGLGPNSDYIDIEDGEVAVFDGGNFTKRNILEDMEDKKAKRREAIENKINNIIGKLGLNREEFNDLREAIRG